MREQGASPSTVSLSTAARMLGISHADALELIDRGEFPCGVLWTSEGHRVTFAALLQALRGNQDAHSDSTPESLHTNSRKDQE
jgi:hypothetical protein